MLSSFALRFGHVLRRSKQIYAKNLLVSNTLSTMGLLGLGDMLCQYVDIRLTQRALLSENKKLIRQLQSHLSSEAPQHKPAHTNKQKEQSKHDLEFIKLEKFDWARTAKVCCVGLLTGPLGHYWYILLDGKLYGNSMKTVLKKVFLDATIASPLFNALFIFVSHTLDGKHLHETYQVFKDKFLIIYAYDTAIWPATQVINFKLVSDTYRLLYVNMMSVFWNAMLSYLLFNDSADTDDDEEESSLDSAEPGVKSLLPLAIPSLASVANVNTAQLSLTADASSSGSVKK